MDEVIPRKSARSTRDWSELNTELLELIFAQIGPQDWMLRSIPFVCKSWNEVLRGPDCWVHIDIERWCRRVNDVSATDTAVRKLVRCRGDGKTKSLFAYKLGDSGFFYACTSGSFLRVLKMPMSEVTDQALTYHIKSLSMLTKLDISYCLQITSKSIEMIGNECKSLVEFRRNMPPPCSDIVVPNESEALAVANTMQGLEHLELAYGHFSNLGLEAIVSRCKKLCALDVRGCWNVSLTKEYLKKLRTVKDFWPPWANEDSDDTDDDTDHDEVDTDEGCD